MTTVNIHEAKTRLSELLSRMESGEEIIIARTGRPIARLCPYEEQGGMRVSGLDRGRVIIHEDFDAPLPEELLQDFER
jgi:prevent-host-death family protein